MTKRGRTDDDTIRREVYELRRIIDGRGIGSMTAQRRISILKASAENYRNFAGALEKRDDYETDHAVNNWPTELRAVADEAERAATVFEKEDRSAAEAFFPGMVSGEGG